MARAPLQVIVIPFRQNLAGNYEFAVFHCAGTTMWQFVAGGAEDAETPLAAAIREAAEEAGMPSDCRWIALDALASVPRTAFPAPTHWPPDLFIVPEHAFAVAVDGLPIKLSCEHTEVRWLPFAEASKQLTWDSNRVALWELNERLAKSRRGVIA